MKSLTPYLMFNGCCEEAIHFYRDSLDGSIDFIGYYDGSPVDVPEDFKNKVMHCTLRFPGGILMASDSVPSENDASQAIGSSVHLSLNFEDEESLQQTFQKLKQGGNVTMEPTRQFWGSTFGMLTDRFGTQWMFNFAGETDKEQT